MEVQIPERMACGMELCQLLLSVARRKSLTRATEGRSVMWAEDCGEAWRQHVRQLVTSLWTSEESRELLLSWPCLSL